MIQLLNQGQYQTFVLLLASIIFALTFHEFAHAASAKYFGDRTAEQQGRLTLNPLSHIDPFGLIMVVMAGFGWARPVPTTPRNFNSRYAIGLVAAAGPASNLLLAFIAINLHGLLMAMGLEFASSNGAYQFVGLFVQINVVLLLFNLIPLGPLDGHYILPYLLSDSYARIYTQYNAQYGTMALIALFFLSFTGVSVFAPLWDATNWLIPVLKII